MSTEIQVRRREKQLTELLMVLLGLYSGGVIDKSRYLELAANLVKSAAEDVREYVRAEATRQRLPEDEAATLFQPLSRVKVDLEQQITDLDTGADPETIKIRLQQTATFTVWDTFMEVVKSIADKAGLRVQWHTALDERVCVICAPREGVIYSVNEVPEYPHPDCRCWLSWI